MVELGRVSRSGFYRCNDDAEPGPDPDMDLRDAIQHIALAWPSYGRPRITAELRRCGWTVNPKRVHRLLREDSAELRSAWTGEDARPHTSTSKINGRQECPPYTS